MLNYSFVNAYYLRERCAKSCIGHSRIHEYVLPEGKGSETVRHILNCSFMNTYYLWERESEMSHNFELFIHEYLLAEGKGE